MGHLVYGFASPPIPLDDRILHYIQLVVATKLRRHESFTLTWVHPDGRGRETLWMQSSIPLRFVFEHAQAENVDMSLLRRLLEAASTSSGITLDSRARESREPASTQRLVHAA